MLSCNSMVVTRIQYFDIQLQIASKCIDDFPRSFLNNCTCNYANYYGLKFAPTNI